jgi:hypothetical protein
LLKEALIGHHGDRDSLLALVAFTRDAGILELAVEFAEH